MMNMVNIVRRWLWCCKKKDGVKEVVEKSYERKVHYRMIYLFVFFFFFWLNLINSVNKAREKKYRYSKNIASYKDGTMDNLTITNNTRINDATELYRPLFNSNQRLVVF